MKSHSGSGSAGRAWPMGLYSLITAGALWVAGGSVAQTPQVASEDAGIGAASGSMGGVSGPGVGESIPPAAQSAQPTATKPNVALLDRRALQLRALLDGTLDPTIDPSGLLRFDLLGPELIGLEATLVGPAEGARPETPQMVRARLAAAQAVAQAQSQSVDLLQAATGRLADAIIDYLRIPAARRRSLLSDHQSRQAAHLAWSERHRSLLARKQALAVQFQDGEAYLAGTLAPERSPDQLFVLDLGVLPAAKAVRKPNRRRRKLSALQVERAQVLATLERDIASLQEGLAFLAKRYLALPVADRARRLAAHRQKLTDLRERQRAEQEDRRNARQTTSKAELDRSEAERAMASAEAERQAALRAAEEARTEAQRLVAAEKVRYLGARKAISAVRRTIADEAAALVRQHDETLGLVRKARELQERSLLDPERHADADRIYGEVLGALGRYQAALADALSWLLSPASRLPEPTQSADARLLEGIDDDELRRLREGNRDLRARARAEEWRLGKDSAAQLRDTVVLLNDARLSLLPEVTPELRSRVRGFGPSGVDQARFELHHMLLMLRYHVMAMPQLVSALADRAMNATLVLVFVLVRVLLLLVAYQFYRRKADGLLTRLYRDLLSGPDVGGLSRTGARVLWYVRRIQRPLGALAFWTLLFRELTDVDVLPEIDFLWTIFVWFFAGWTLVLLVDAFASRQNAIMRKRSEDPALRFRSLRLLAQFFLGTGLLLSLTELSVGQGTIYAWTRLLAWMSLLPLLWVLASWWTKQTRRNLEARAEQSRIATWSLAQMDRRLAGLGALVGGGYVLSEGLVRWLTRWLAEFDLVQRLSAYLFRKQLQERAEGKTEPGSAEAADAYPTLSPGLSAPEILEGLHAESFAAVMASVRQRGSMTFVVGDRGMGKSVVLRRVAVTLGGRCATLRSGSGFAALRTAVATAVGKSPEVDDECLSETLRPGQFSALLIDDLHRLIRPDVFGLREFDAALAFLRRVAAAVPVVVACEAPAYRIVECGRNRMGIDRVVELAAMSRADVTALVRSRCAAAGLKPSFDKLVVPRSFDFEGSQNEDPIENGYYRLLWNYCGGNPAVALLYFQKSIAHGSGAQPLVALFPEPSRSELERLPRDMPFVFRALVQLGAASVANLASCLNMPLTDAQAAVDLGLRRGYFEQSDGQTSVALDWYREIRVLLRRQHLLS